MANRMSAAFAGRLVVAGCMQNFRGRVPTSRHRPQALRADDKDSAENNANDNDSQYSPLHEFNSLLDRQAALEHS